jgi:hypothetical protein
MRTRLLYAARALVIAGGLVAAGTGTAPAFAAVNNGPIQVRAIYSDAGNGCDISLNVTPTSPKVGLLVSSYKRGTSKMVIVLKALPNATYQMHANGGCDDVGKPFTTNGNGVGFVAFSILGFPGNYGTFWFSNDADDSVLTTDSYCLAGGCAI